ncbi:M55 family metallopeptidase [Oceanobacillus iheyensis]|uniref:Dipeptide ABC transporter ATP-binding protein n=1 Tax=Oceanobacillus iheyensis (strain DSM 14371 / CIP 107618 / JCM 11309 / KCTC 3954 / HTE831) TaxID=221109 RepID=Q8EM87_OCEIH|nr:M55 family metallopeptidase [Oceanobacillus iheyensis]BAC14927.1 dipeptide ABC transporter ATP-binding protein [Oceanobacillus iheyensis HTE831]
MKIYISVDMEGITGLPDFTFVDAKSHNYERSRKIMTKEVNYVIQAAFDNGCKEVLVNDSHSKMNNLLIEDIHPDCHLITGEVKPFSMVQGLDQSLTGAFLVGYHSQAGRPGVMSHSMIHAVRNFFINDHCIGEMGMNAYLAGYYNVPILLVTGDDYTAMEAEELIPGVTTAIVKESISRSSVKSLTPSKAGVLLEEKVKQALKSAGNVAPLTPPEQPTLTIEFCNYGQAEWANLMPGTALIEGTTKVSFPAKNMKEAYQAMLVMTELAMHTTFS